MSQRKIRQSLKVKGIPVIDVFYERSAPVPEGYASGYSLEFSEECVELIFDMDNLTSIEEYMDFDFLDDVLQFLDTLPTLNTDQSKALKEQE
tara:strand:+ start:248 stop:523 length:276 start_codon:yes stop_codon:yes gene_type:complete